jgi:hypothetical protein
MLTKKTLNLARQQMSAYGELETGALEPQFAKVVGHSESLQNTYCTEAQTGNAVTPSKGKIRTWNELKGAWLIVDA